MRDVKRWKKVVVALWVSICPAEASMAAQLSESDLMKLIASQQAQLKAMVFEIKAMREELGIQEGSPANWSEDPEKVCPRVHDWSNCKQKDRKWLDDWAL